LIERSDASGQHGWVWPTSADRAIVLAAFDGDKAVGQAQSFYGRLRWRSKVGRRASTPLGARDAGGNFCVVLGKNSPLILDLTRVQSRQVRPSVR
jgi:hypothetical protein